MTVTQTTPFFIVLRMHVLCMLCHGCYKMTIGMHGNIFRSKRENMLSFWPFIHMGPALWVPPNYIFCEPDTTTLGSCYYVDRQNVTMVAAKTTQFQLHL